MVWSLRIHHIDVINPGDATLIVARNDGVGAGHVAQTRSALIDGGHLMAAPNVDAYVAAQVADVDVIAVTHYDADHFNGIRGLINMVPAAAAAGLATPYDNAVIFDQGEPAVDDPDFVLYLNAVAAAGLTRVTRAVSSDPPVPVKVRLGLPVVPGVVPNVHTPPRTYLVHGVAAIAGVIAINPPIPLAAPMGAALGAAATAGWWHPYWLLGREILWTDAAGEPIAPASPGAPTITCIAVNRYVRTGPLTSQYRAGGLLAAPARIKNEKSLAFEVRFGNFRYYIGGDIENVQETTIAPYLNQTDTLADRVQVIKTSHHGANTATAPAFVARMRPRAAMISCGLTNPHGHPTAGTLATLDGAAAGAPPRQPVDYYLTGYLFPGMLMGGMVAPPTPYYAGPPAWAYTAGDPLGPPVRSGHIVVEVSAVQSAASPLGLRANTLIAAIIATGVATGTATVPALRDDAIEAELSSAPGAAAVNATIVSVLNFYGYGAPPAIAAGAIAGGLLATIPAAYALATGVGATPGEAAVTAAAAGVAVALDGTPPIAMALLASVVTSTAVNLVPAAAAGAAAAGLAAQAAVNAVYNPTGQCTVRFYNRNHPLGPGHYPYHLH